MPRSKVRRCITLPRSYFAFLSFQARPDIPTDREVMSAVVCRTLPLVVKYCSLFNVGVERDCLRIIGEGNPIPQHTLRVSGRLNVPIANHQSSSPIANFNHQSPIANFNHQSH